MIAVRTTRKSSPLRAALTVAIGITALAAGIALIVIGIGSAL